MITPYSNTIEVTTLFSGLLDTYPNAAAVYSLRRLSGSYSGSAIRVRRAVGSPSEKDIGFVDNELDVADLQSFCSGTDGFVVTWYDQSGNGRDATQTSASNQPQIVSSGSVILENSKPSVQFDGSDDNFLTNLSINSDFSAFVVATSNQIDRCDILRGGSSGAFLAGSADDNHIYRLRTNSSALNYYNMDLLQHLHIWVNDSSTSYAAIDNDTFLSTSDTPINQTSIYIGGDTAISSATFMWKGTMQEIIIYALDQSTNRTGIETNINANYNIYWDGSQTSLLDTYSGSAAAYSLRALSSAYTGPLVRVRRASDNAEQDIYAKYDGTLNVSSLESFCSGTNGFVKTWYDQSGNGYDAEQTTLASQPQIVSSGSVITENGKPSVQFDGTSDFITNQLIVGPTVTSFAISRIVSESDFNFIYDSFESTLNGRIRLGLWSNNRYFADNGDGNYVNPTTASNGLQHLFFAKHTSSNVEISIDQDVLKSQSTTAFSQNTEYWQIGARNDGADHYLDGTIQELIIYPSDQSTNRTGIETNINTYYSIY